MAKPPDGFERKGNSPDSQHGELLTQAAYAKRRGWSKQYVNQLVKQGRIELIEGKVDPAAADAALSRDRDPTRQAGFTTDRMNTPVPEISPQQDAAARIQGSFVKARTVRENYRALRERLEYERIAGNLVPKDELEDAAFEVGVAVRDGFMNTANEIGISIAREFSVNQARAIEIASELVEQTLLTTVQNLRHIAEQFGQKTRAK